MVDGKRLGEADEVALRERVGDTEVEREWVELGVRLPVLEERRELVESAPLCLQGKSLKNWMHS